MVLVKEYLIKVSGYEKSSQSRHVGIELANLVSKNKDLALEKNKIKIKGYIGQLKINLMLKRESILTSIALKSTDYHSTAIDI